jgi:hypothetical protein
VLAGDVTEPFLESIDRLLREINRRPQDPDRARPG